MAQVLHWHQALFMWINSARRQYKGSTSITFVRTVYISAYSTPYRCISSASSSMLFAKYIHSSQSLQLGLLRVTLEFFHSSFLAKVHITQDKCMSGKAQITVTQQLSKPPWIRGCRGDSPNTLSRGSTGLEPAWMCIAEKVMARRSRKWVSDTKGTQGPKQKSNLNWQNHLKLFGTQKVQIHGNSFWNQGDSAEWA